MHIRTITLFSSANYFIFRRYPPLPTFFSGFASGYRDYWKILRDYRKTSVRDMVAVKVCLVGYTINLIKFLVDETECLTADRQPHLGHNDSFSSARLNKFCIRMSSPFSWIFDIC